jgi:hypothetical protein
MPTSSDALLLTGVCLLGLVVPFVAAQAMSGNRVHACGTQENPIEVVLPAEVQASLFHSLPIAGLVSTPDAMAERVLSDPRLRATTVMHLTGKGVAHPVHKPGVVCTHADLID